MVYTLPPPNTILYKYYNYASALRFLREGLVRFSPLASFNDPFELNAYPGSNITQEALGNAVKTAIIDVIDKRESLQVANRISQYVMAYQQGMYQHYSPAEFAELLGEQVAAMQPVSAPPQAARTLHAEYARRIGAFCLTEKFDNLLMWAHYADQYKGMVIGFDPHKLGGEFACFAPVNYRDAFPSIEDVNEAADSYLGRPHAVPDSLDAFMLENVFVKGHDWRDEKEWRAVRFHECEPRADHETYDISKQLIQVPNEAVVSIHLGCRVTDDQRSMVCDLAYLFNSATEVYKSRVSHTRFELEFIPAIARWPSLPYDDHWEIINT